MRQRLFGRTSFAGLIVGSLLAACGDSDGHNWWGTGVASLTAETSRGGPNVDVGFRPTEFGPTSACTGEQPDPFTDVDQSKFFVRGRRDHLSLHACMGTVDVPCLQTDFANVELAVFFDPAVQPSLYYAEARQASTSWLEFVPSEPPVLSGDPNHGLLVAHGRWEFRGGASEACADWQEESWSDSNVVFEWDVTDIWTRDNEAMPPEQYLP